MKRVCKRAIQIDALTLCFKALDDYTISQLALLPMGEYFESENVTLTRVDGKYYANVYSILIEQGDEARFLGHLKFGLNHGNSDSNVHKDGSSKIWITLNNETLYPLKIETLEQVAKSLRLELRNLTTLDLCLDTPFNISKCVCRYIRKKEIATILNGKKVLDRDEDRPELCRILSGSLNKDKYVTLCIKQRNAVRDKFNGVTVTTYDKAAEIRNASGKDYILNYYGNPSKLFRTEVHLNNAEIRRYLESHKITLNYQLFNNIAFLEDMFYYFLNSVIRFQDGRKSIKWEDVLGKPKVC